ncbi:MAG: hypothetical protein M0P33_03685 [Massilibacteroides sp.]|nr:hypothetical protein [Massilibacteroides sp.]
MKKPFKEILYGAGFLFFVVLSFVFYSLKTNLEKARVKQDILAVAAQNAIGLIRLNQPSFFWMLEQDYPQIQPYWRPYVPLYIKKLAQATGNHSPLLLSFYPDKSSLCFIKSKTKHTFNAEFGGYPPITKTIGNVKINYYPLTDGTFLGVFNHHGFYVASTTRTTLENLAKQLQTLTVMPSLSFNEKDWDKNAPINVWLNASTFSLNEMGENIIADLFVNDTSFCSFSPLPNTLSLRRKTTALTSDTIPFASKALQKKIDSTILHDLKLPYIESHLDQINHKDYYTACIKLDSIASILAHHKQNGNAQADVNLPPHESQSGDSCE